MDAAQRDEVLDIAIGAINDALDTGRLHLPTDLPDHLQRRGCAFVTLRRDGALLGCVGALEPYQPLGQDVAEHAYAAAFEDPRFLPVTDLRGVHIEVSVLGPLRPFPAESYADVVERIPRSGAVVEAMGRRGTFLPAVWQQIPEPSEFVASLWRKAGLVPGTWPARVWTYDVEEFGREVQ